jgi:hypothetical protein
MGALDFLKELEGRTLDAASFKLLQRNYEMQEENNRLLKEKVLILESHISDLKIKVNEISNENLKLKEENRILNEKISLAIEKPQLKNGLYYFNEDGPYCTSCWDENKEKIRLIETVQALQSFGNFKCPVCRTNYK